MNNTIEKVKTTVAGQRRGSTKRSETSRKLKELRNYNC